MHDGGSLHGDQRSRFLDVAGISVGYGRTTVLEALDLAVGKGEFVALLGASGCGKTTLLRTIAGFVAPRSGTVTVAGRDVTRLSPDRRGMALMFQSYALWPHMTVAQNIGYGLKLRRRGRSEIAGRVAEIEGLLGLRGLGGRKPAELSGGQRQRVALGRALAIEPDILLLDEPLSNLDARIRVAVRQEIRALQQRLGITAILVTHDREEAMVMADRIVILDAGRIAQAGTPEAVYNRPQSEFVAAFMGAENALPLPAGTPGGRRVARFRPEAARLAAVAAPSPEPPAADLSDGLAVEGTVSGVGYPGGLWRHLVEVAGTQVVVDAAAAHAPGARVRVHVPADALYVFEAADAPMGAAPTSPLPAADAGRGSLPHRNEEPSP